MTPENQNPRKNKAKLINHTQARNWMLHEYNSMVWHGCWSPCTFSKIEESKLCELRLEEVR